MMQTPKDRKALYYKCPPDKTCVIRSRLKCPKPWGVWPAMLGALDRVAFFDTFDEAITFATALR